MKKILAFAGSNNSKSINKTFAKYATNQVDKATEFIDLENYDVPLYGIDFEDKNGIPEATQRLNEKISQFDFIIISSNEHNGAISSFFKNHIDWLSRNDRNFLKDKKLLLLSTSPGRGGAKMSLSYLVEVLPRFGAEVLSHFALASFGHCFSEEQGITDEEQKKEFEVALKKFKDKI